MSLAWLSSRRDHSWSLKTVKSSVSNLARLFSIPALAAVNGFNALPAESVSDGFTDAVPLLPVQLLVMMMARIANDAVKRPDDHAHLCSFKCFALSLTDNAKLHRLSGPVVTVSGKSVVISGNNPLHFVAKADGVCPAFFLNTLVK